MCWIFAYNGTKNSVPLLIEWLRTLEYRWYDSAWIMAVDKNWKVFYKKAVWRVSVLATEVENDSESENNYTTGIAHTRWATHWTVTKDNTHPHNSSNKRFYVVHNGIIENYKELKKQLEKKYKFYSETDTEVIAKLIEDLFEKDLKTTMGKVSKKLVWAYSVAVVDSENPDTIVWIKLWSPLIIWEWDSEIFISSDVNALSSVAHSYVRLEDNEMVVIKNAKYQVFASGKKLDKQAEDMDIEYDAWDLWTFSSFTEKEIFEIPTVIENTFKWRIDFESKMVNNETINELNELDIDKIEIIASWSSYYAGFMWCYYFKELAGIKSEVIISSEFLSDTFIPSKKTLYIFLSQSWETADVRESLKIVKAKWWLTFWVVNVVWSTIARLVDMWFFTHAWIEVWVASTKNVIAQISVLLVMAIGMWIKRDLQPAKARALIEDMEKLPDRIREVLVDAPKAKKIAKKYSKYEHMFMLWRNVLYPAAGECSLKCKELSYIHTESYSTGELKHWPLALVWPDFPCIVLNPNSRFYSKNISNIKEIRAREGTVLWVITKWENDDDLYDDVLEIPRTKQLLTPFTALASMYLFGMYLAEDLWRDVDKPRNLAKSVTVE